MISPTARTERRAIATQPTSRTALPPRKTDSYGNPIALIPERRENAAGVEGPNTTITARIGMTTIAIESRGAIGIKQTVPIPTVPGLGATGGLKINTTTGKIEQVSVGVSYINLVSVDFALEGCNVIITLSAGMPGTVTFVTTSQTHEIPNCKPDKPTEAPQTPQNELSPWEAPSPGYKGLDPNDPATFPPLPPNCAYIISVAWPLVRERQIKTKNGCEEGERYIYGYTIPIPLSVLRANYARTSGFQNPGPPYKIFEYKNQYYVDGITLPFYRYQWAYCSNEFTKTRDTDYLDQAYTCTRFHQIYGGEILFRSNAFIIKGYSGWHRFYPGEGYSMLLDWKYRYFEEPWRNEFNKPVIIEVGSTCSVLPSDAPKLIKPKTPTNSPGFQPTKRKMDECCKALGRQIEEIHAALAAGTFPHEIPEYLSNRGENVSIENYWQAQIDLHKKIDDLLGEFPVKLKVTTDENQTKEEELVTVADALADIYSLCVATFFDADNVFSLCTKVITALVEMKAIAQQTYDISYITNEQLGFEVERKPTKMQLPIDPRYPDDWVKFNQPWEPDEPNTLKWENRDDATLKAYLLELTKHAVVSSSAVSIKGKPEKISERVAKMAEIMKVITNSSESLDTWLANVQALSREATLTTPEIRVTEE